MSPRRRGACLSRAQILTTPLFPVCHAPFSLDGSITDICFLVCSVLPNERATQLSVSDVSTIVANEIRIAWHLAHLTAENLPVLILSTMVHKIILIMMQQCGSFSRLVHIDIHIRYPIPKV